MKGRIARFSAPDLLQHDEASAAPVWRRLLESNIAERAGRDRHAVWSEGVVSLILPIDMADLHVCVLVDPAGPRRRAGSGSLTIPC